MDRKILALIDEKSGSRLHRIKEPLSRMKNVNVTFLNSNEFKEELLEDMDILWVNRLAPVESVRLEQLLDKYNVKYIIDLDDCVDVGGKHIDSKRLEIQKPLLIRHLIIADLVIVSDGYLIPDVAKYNDTISLVPNRIPFNEGQYVLDGKLESDKIRFGIIGSISHYYDYLSLRGAMKRILGDKEFQDKCKIVIAANPENKYWKDVLSVFKHKNVELEILPLKGLEDYMELYNHVDVVLAPLEDNKFNKCRTNLKIYEAACKEIPVIGDKMFLDKGVNCFAPVSKSSDWYDAIKYFIKNKNYRQFGKEVKEFLMKETPYEFIVTKREELVNIVMNKDKNSLPTNVDVHTIVYEESQYSPFNKYDNSHIKTIEQDSFLFEYNPILDINNHLVGNEGYIGVFSHKFSSKTGLSPKILGTLLVKNNYEEFDVINLCHNYWNTGKEYLEFSEEQHPGLLERLKEVCKVVGLDYSSSPNVINYSNFYLMKKELFKDYVDNYITPAIEYMKSKPERFMVDAGYATGLSKEDLKKYSELDFYTYHVFILERMNSMYFEKKELKVLSLI